MSVAPYYQRETLLDISRIPTAADVASARFEDIYEAPQGEPGWLELESSDCLSMWQVVEQRQKRGRTQQLQTGLASRDGLFVPAGALVRVKTVALDTVHTTDRGLRTALAATPLQAVRWYPGLDHMPASQWGVVGWQADSDAGSGADTVAIPAATNVNMGSPPGYCRHIVGYLEDVAQLRLQLRTLADVGAGTVHFDGQASARVKSLLVHPWMVVGVRNLDGASAHRFAAVWSPFPNNPASI